MQHMMLLVFSRTRHLHQTKVCFQKGLSLELSQQHAAAIRGGHGLTDTNRAREWGGRARARGVRLEEEGGEGGGWGGLRKYPPGAYR